MTNLHRVGHIGRDCDGRTWRLFREVMRNGIDPLCALRTEKELCFTSARNRAAAAPKPLLAPVITITFPAIPSDTVLLPYYEPTCRTDEEMQQHSKGNREVALPLCFYWTYEQRSTMTARRTKQRCCASD
jgi:hypothetical protein